MRNAEMARMYANDVQQPSPSSESVPDDMEKLSQSDTVEPQILSESFESECNPERQNVLVMGISVLILVLSLFEMQR